MFSHGKGTTFHRIAIGAFVVALMCGASRSVEAQPRSVTIPDGVGDWAVHESSGRVFASLASGNEVVEYDSSAREVRRIKVGEKPKELIIKRDWLFVACTKSPALHAIDLKSNEESAVVPLNGKGPYALFCSEADNNYVYCVCNTGTSWWDGEVFQIDFRSKQIRKRVKVQPWGQSNVVHVVMSRDGKWIVPDARGASSPSGADLMKVDEDEGTFTQVRDYHESFGQMVAGPFNRYWTFGNLLYSLDITSKVRTFAGTPVAIHPQLDLAASKTADGLSLERFSDATAIDTIKLPADNAAERKTPSDRASQSRQEGGPSFDPTVQFDIKHNLVFVGTDSQGFWVDLQPYADRIAFLKVVQAPSEISTLVGKPLKVPLQLTNAQRPPIAKLRIAEGPASATLAGDEFSWTPQAEDVGFVKFRLEVVSTSDQKVLDSAELTVNVTLPKVDLEFHAKSMNISEDGRHLVVWGLAPGEEARHPAHTGPDNIAIIDLKTLKIVASKTLPQGIRCAAIDSKYVYLAPNSGNLFYRFDHGLAGGERQFLQSAPDQLTKIAPNILAAVGEQFQTFEVNPMKPIPFEGSPRFNPHFQKAIEALGQNELRIGSRIFNRQTGKTLQITGVVNLPPLIPNTAGTSIPNPNQTPVRWGRQVNGSSLMNYKGGQIAAWPGNRSGVISERWPLAVVIAPTQQNQLVNTMLELCDLVDGTVKHSAVIDVSPGRGSSVSFYGAMNRMLVHEQTILYLSDTELLVATIPKNIAESMPVPTHFTREQVTEIELSKTAEIALRTEGPRQDVTFSLIAESPGISLNSKTGVVNVELQDLWSNMLKTVTGTNHQFQNPNQQASSSRAENAKIYKELTGKELPEGKFAACLPISAVLQDSEGQEDGIKMSVIVVGPRQEVDAAIQKQKDDQAQQLAQMEAQQKKMREESAAAQRKAELEKAEQKSGKGTPERLDELEARMRRIEAALDAILNRLEKKPQ